VKRVNASADVLNGIMGAPDEGIPQDLMESALCLGVVPSLKKGGFVFGAEYGRASPPAARQPGGALRRLSKWSAVAGAYRSVEKLLIW
jgi:lipid-binding SYLF domain-containing protein